MTEGSLPSARSAAEQAWPSGEWTRAASWDRAAGSSFQPPGPGYNDTSEFFMGSVAVGVFLVESTGSAYDWSDGEVAQTLDGIYAGLAWWASLEPKARLSFSYELYVREPTTWEPIQHSLDDDWLWIDEILTNRGYSESDPWNKSLHFNNDLRGRLGTDWAYSIFVADSDDAVNMGRFTNDQYAAAYLGGPWITMSRFSSWAYNSADYFRVVPAHETGHIFYATDEYDYDPVEYSGYLNCPDNNAAPGIMNRNTLSISASTRCQVGWIDADGDGVLDILDVPPGTTILPHSPNPTSETVVTYVGSATVVALPNQNPYGFGNGITISRTTGVSVRVDNGTWSDAHPVDGSFDEANESYSFDLYLGPASAVSPLPAFSNQTLLMLSAEVNKPSGSRFIESQSRNTEGNADGTPAFDVLRTSSQPPANVELWYSKDSGTHSYYAAVTAEPWQWTFNTSATGGDGDYRFYSVAVDAAGNREPIPPSDDAVAFVDTTPPELEILAPSELIWLRSSETTASWSASDSGSDVYRIFAALDGQSSLDIGTSGTYVFNSLSEGIHTFVVIVQDRAGNQVAASRTFGVDMTAPTVAIASPPDASVSVENTVVAAWTGSDLHSGIERYEVHLDAGDFAPLGTDTSFTFAGLPDGLHTITVRAVDVAGNEQEVRVTFRVHADWLTGGGRYGWLPLGLLLLGSVASFSTVVIWWRRRRRSKQHAPKG